MGGHDPELGLLRAIDERLVGRDGGGRGGLSIEGRALVWGARLDEVNRGGPMLKGYQANIA
jgi:hypothetical protein